MKGSAVDTLKLENKAINGDRDSAHLVGLLFLMGEGGVKKDVSKGLKYLELAVDGGCKESAYALGVTYAAGTDLAQDFKLACVYFKKAVELGKREAQLDLNRLQPLVDAIDRLA